MTSLYQRAKSEMNEWRKTLSAQQRDSLRHRGYDKPSTLDMLSAPDKRTSKNAALRQYRHNAVNKYKKALKRRDGRTGAASAVRHIVKDGAKSASP